jgi:hypothetical protein
MIVSGAGYNGPNMIANLPIVPQASYTPHGGKNGLETLLAVVVPPGYSTPTPGHQKSQF